MCTHLNFESLNDNCNDAMISSIVSLEVLLSNAIAYFMMGESNSVEDGV